MKKELKLLDYTIKVKSGNVIERKFSRHAYTDDQVIFYDEFKKPVLRIFKYNLISLGHKEPQVKSYKTLIICVVLIISIAIVFRFLTSTYVAILITAIAVTLTSFYYSGDNLNKRNMKAKELKSIELGNLFSVFALLFTIIWLIVCIVKWVTS